MSKPLGLPVSQRRMRRNLRALLAQATPDDMRTGITWYADAQAYALALSAQVNSDDPRERLETAAAVIAAHSPRTFWGANRAAAFATVTGSKMPTGIMGTNITRADNALMYGFDGIGNGPKVNAFARNIAGDLSHVTVDVWAFRAAMGIALEHPESLLARKGAYAEISRAYVAVARENDLDPAVLQAIIWTVVRGVKPSDNTHDHTND
jgi:hypothetical protein